jgi:V8-like Glu-specific endopeptidase
MGKDKGKKGKNRSSRGSGGSGAAVAAAARALAAVADAAASPWRSVALLDITYENGNKATGTAWFFGERCLATAGHNIRHPQNGEAVEILVWPARNGAAGTLGPYRVPDNGMHCDPRWRAGSADPSLDYGALVLDDPTPGRQLGWFDLQAFDDGRLRGLDVQICGYPFRAGGRSQFRNEGRFQDVERQALRYRFATVVGMSGAPVFAKVGDGWVAVGIHTGSDGRGDSARRIDTGLRQFLKGLSGG